MTAIPVDPATTPGYSPVSSTGASATAQVAPRILKVEVEPTPPWLAAVEARLNDLLALGPGWDTYGAPPIDPSHVIEGVRLLFRLLPLEGPEPWIVPTTSRGVQFEWHLDDVEVEARVDDEGAQLFVMDEAGEDEGDPAYRSDLLARAARALVMPSPV